jgi:hypothetical protein
MSIATVEVDDSEPESLIADGESGRWVSGDDVKLGTAKSRVSIALSWHSERCQMAAFSGQLSSPLALALCLSSLGFALPSWAALLLLLPAEAVADL